MTLFEDFLELLDSLISETNFIQLMNDLSDKSPDYLLLHEVISKLRQKQQEFENSSETITVDFEHDVGTMKKEELFEELTEIYEEIRDKLVYIPFVAFTKVFIQMADNIIKYNQNKNKEFVLILPSNSLNTKSDIKSNIVFTAFLINYLKMKGKLEIISGIILLGYSNVFRKNSTGKTGIFRHNSTGFSILTDDVLKKNTDENTIFIYCDDGLYSGVQFNRIKETSKKQKIDLVPMIPFLRENYVVEDEFSDKKYRFSYERFPLATKINSKQLCRDGLCNVLGYFQHKIPDSLSISLCIPFLDTIEKYTREDFGKNKSVLKNVVYNRQETYTAEYKKLKYKNSPGLEKFESTLSTIIKNSGL